MLTSGCFFLFIALEGYYVVLLVLGIFAIGAILSESARPVHILEQEISLKIGETSAVSILSTMERIGGFLGPIVFRVAAIFNNGIRLAFLMLFRNSTFFCSSRSFCRYFVFVVFSNF